MEVFSLEEDEGDSLFITQEPSDKNGDVVHSDSSEDFLGLDQMDFQLPCVSIRSDRSSSYQNNFSDISDDEFQQVDMSAVNKDR